MTTFHAAAGPGSGHDNDNDLCHVAALVRAFFQVFDNREGRRPQEAALRACCLSSAVVRVLGPEGLKEMDLEAFWRPREALLTSGRLVAFHEWPLEELAGQVWVDGDLASARVRYAKAGWLDGAPWEGAGFKHFQMVRMTDGWRIASLAWQDDA